MDGGFWFWFWACMCKLSASCSVLWVALLISIREAYRSDDSATLSNLTTFMGLSVFGIFCGFNLNFALLLPASAFECVSKTTCRIALALLFASTPFFFLGSISVAVSYTYLSAVASRHTDFSWPIQLLIVWLAFAVIRLATLWHSLRVKLLAATVAQRRPHPYLSLLHTAPHLTDRVSAALSLSPLIHTPTCPICSEDFGVTTAITIATAQQHRQPSRGCCLLLSTPTSNSSDTICLLECHHPYHHHCIRTWYMQGRYTCPNCLLDSAPLQTFNVNHRPIGMTNIGPLLAAPTLHTASADITIEMHTPTTTTAITT
jgi:hypothetical protein